MSTDLTPFTYDGLPIQTVSIDGEPWFVAGGVAEVLGLGNPRSSLALLDDDEKGVHTMDTLGGQQSVAIVNESGLYSLILRSRKPEAKAFKRWITHEVLPAIRKTGSYTVAESREQLLARAMIEATNTLAERDQQIAELAPKAKTFDVFLSSVGDYSVNEAAKALSRDHGILTGQQRLFTFMEKLGWIYRDTKARPIPYQTQVENGRLVAKPQFHFHPETGEVVADPPQIRVTAKGLEALHQKYKAQAS